MVTIGCGRTVKPVTFSVLGKDGKDKAVRGTVSYIHPARRYCILEFAVRGGILRESFQLIDGEIAEYLAFARNSKKDSADAGKESGTVLTEIGYIKANTDDIKRKQEKQDETLVKMTERVVKLEGDSARTNKRLEILESHDYGGSK